jgi:hypothetical protein
VKVPIGKSLKAQGKEHISFNTKNELSHILMVGGIGSGKTNFLKTIITSISIEYNPDEVELYLIDMKSGAGFSVFETEKLPHAKLYVFSAENELIKDVFENLKQEMDRRYAEYSKYNIDNLQDIYKDPSLAPFAPKRKIVIIDEFASIYTDDEMYHDEISSNILNIAQKGRAMGINLFFATQNFNNISSSAFNQAATQFATRIVLKGSPESSSSILGTSNDGFKEVTRIGEGFVNTNYGQINSDGGNHFFKSFLLDNEDLIPLLKEIRETAESRKLCKSESVLIDGAKPADFTTNAELFALQKSADAQNKYRKNGISSYLGEAFLMKEPNHFYFSWKLNGKSAGQNILIAGNEREIAVEAVYSLISSLTHGVPDAEFAIKFINPLDPDYSRDLGMDKLPELLKKYAYEEFGEKDLMFVFEKLQIIIDNRKKSGDRFPIVVIIPALENFVKMHRAGGYDLQPEAALFKELLSNGSNYGIYFICEINKPGNFSKMGIAADFLQHFDHRIAFFMNSEESINMIDSKMANKLVSEDNQNVRNKGLYYNQSSQSCYKFKSYSGLIFHENMIRNLKKEINDLYKLESIAGSDVDPDNKNNSDDLLTDEIGTEDAMMSFINNINLDDIPEDATITIPETNETSEEENI